MPKTLDDVRNEIMSQFLDAAGAGDRDTAEQLAELLTDWQGLDEILDEVNQEEKVRFCRRQKKRKRMAKRRHR